MRSQIRSILAKMTIMYEKKLGTKTNRDYANVNSAFALNLVLSYEIFEFIENNKIIF